MFKTIYIYKREKINIFCTLERIFLNDLSIIVVECCPLRQESITKFLFMDTLFMVNFEIGKPN